MLAATSSTVVPEAWEALLTSLERGTILVLGDQSTGKNRLARFLLGQLDRPLRRVALIDTDPGAPEIGAPACLGLALTGPWEAPAGLWFVGAYRWQGTLQAVAGLTALAQRAEREGAQATIIDASGGMAETAHRPAGESDPDLAYHLAIATRAEQIIALQRGRELEPALALLETPGRQIHRVQAPRIATGTSNSERRRERRRRRDRRLEAHFHGARLHRFGLCKVLGGGGATENRTRTGFLEPRTLVGLIGRDGLCLALGVVESVGADQVAVLTPWSDTPAVHGLAPGSVHIDSARWKKS